MDAAELACASLVVIIRGGVFNNLVLAEIGDPGMATFGCRKHCELQLRAPSFPRPRVQDVKPHTSTFMRRYVPTHRDPLEELCDSLKMPQDYADRMDSIGLSYGAVITMKPSDLMLMLALIMKPEQSQIFARHVLLMNSNQCQDSREHLCHG